VLAQATKMQGRILDAVAAAAPRLARGSDVALPAKLDRKSLRALVQLTTITIHGVARDGVALVGYGLACTWDREHGVGVLTHGDRVLEVGAADTALLRWVAERASKKRR
jgi:hypothetical protein